MKTTKSFLLTILAVFFTLTVLRAQTPDQAFHLYILIGQSNMAGRGAVSEVYKDEVNTRVYMLNKVNQWVLARHPLHFDKPAVAGVGPGLAFGIKMIEATGGPGIRIGLIPCAVGGTPIENWIPDAYDVSTGTHPFNDAVIRIRQAMRTGVVKGIIWHQGESNASPGQGKKYLEQLADLIERFRRVVEEPNMPFVVGELGHYRAAYADFNAELAKLPHKVPHTAVVTTEGLNHRGDTLHFDSPSAEELGRRYAVKMLMLQKVEKGKK